MKATWLGHAAWELDGSRRIYIDPFLDENPKASKKAKDVTKADVVVVSHDHFDHVADAVPICKRTGATLVATYDLAVSLAEKHGIKAEGMNIGGTMTVEGVEVSLVLAFHTAEKGHPTGTVIRLDGKTIYHAGDTCLFGDMKIIGEFFAPIDLALIPIGDRFTMGPPSAAKAVEWLRPRRVVPMHYDTWPPIAQDPRSFKELVGDRSEVVILEPGQSIEV